MRNFYKQSGEAGDVHFTHSYSPPTLSTLLRTSTYKLSSQFDAMSSVAPLFWQFLINKFNKFLINQRWNLKVS